MLPRKSSPILATLLSCTMLLAGCGTDAPAANYTPAIPISDHGPAYPAAMARVRQEGHVVMDCTITASGFTRDCNITEATNLDFAAAAEAYVARNRYRPARYGGTPVAVAHHRLHINFEMAPIVFQVAFNCEVATTGHVRNCRSLPSPGPVPKSFSDVMAAQLATLSVVTRKGAGGQAVAEPHRTIEVVMALEDNPPGHPRMPSLPSAQVQVNLLLDCRADTLPRCQEISEPPANARPDRSDRIVRALIGFNGVIPTTSGSEDAS